MVNKVLTYTVNITKAKLPIFKLCSEDEDLHAQHNSCHLK